MNLRLYSFFILLMPLFVYSQFDQKKVYEIKRINNPPKIDGSLEDEVWNEFKNNPLHIAKDFIQLEPNNGQPEREGKETNVKICYDDRHLYFGVMMYDNFPDSILKQLSKRDEKEKNCDFFGIWINPFNDGQIEYEFTVTAAGVQADSKITPNSYDKSWNSVWKSAVKINEEGWVVEIAIPFSALRFPNHNQDWAINMARRIRRYREDYSWNPIDVSYGKFGLQAGILRGVKNINSPLRLSFMPYASIYLESNEEEIAFPYNVGMDLKYGLNESFTLDMTLIPDFGQVASDAQVLNLSPFEIRYEEKRQFFNEGTELFNKGGDMFYSRRVEDDLLNATKVSGRTKNGLGIATLNAVTNQTDAKPLTNYNVTIFDQAFKNNSSISLMNTNMVQAGDNKTSNVTGIFGYINILNTHLIQSTLKMSQEVKESGLDIEPPQKYTERGFKGNVSLSKTNGAYRYSLSSRFEDDKYNPNDLGFLYANNEIEHFFSASYHQFKENKKFINSKISTSISYKSLFTDYKFVNLRIESQANVMLKNYLFFLFRTEIHPYEKNDFYEARTGDYNNPLKRSKQIKISSHISTDYRKRFAIDISAGGSILPLHDGSVYHWRISPRYRLNDNISLSYVLSVRNKYNDVGFVANDTSGLLIEPPQIDHIFAERNTYMITNVLSGNYIINNKMDFSLKLRYHLDQVENLKFKSLGNDGYLYDSNYQTNNNINYTTWTSDIAFNWWFSAGSQISLVWKNAIDNQTDILINSWIDNLENSFSLAQQNSLSLKVIYYLDYLYLKKNDKS